MKPTMRQFPIILIALGLALLASLARSLENMADSQPVPGVFSASALPQDQISSPASPSARFEKITTADGLSFPIVRDILQDRQGFMWFATDSGLNRYDGYEFTVYKHDPGDPKAMRFDDATVIFEDRDGTLWVGGGGGLDRFDRTTETFTHVDTRGQVFSIYEDSVGTLWVGFWHGLYGYDRGTNEIIHSNQPDPDAPDDWGARSQTQSAVVAIHEDQKGDLWIGTVAGLHRLDRTTGVFTHYRHDPNDPASLSSDTIDAIHEDRQGTLWIGTAEGLNKLVLDGEEQERFVRLQHDPDDPDSLSDGEVISILEDSAGSLWVGTSNGLNRRDPSASHSGEPAEGSGPAQSQSRFLHYQHDPQDPHSLGDNVVLSLFEDRSGVLWVGTANGVNKYNRREAQFIRYQKHWDPPASPSYTLDVSGLLRDPQPAILSNDRILAIYEDESGVLWIGTFGGGLNRLDRQSGRLTVYRHDPTDDTSLSSNVVRAVLKDRAGILWIGTGNGWLDQFDPQTETFSHYRYLGEASLSAMAEDLAGNLWLGTSGEGLFRLDNTRETLVHYPQYWRDPDHWWREGSLSSHIISSLHIDRAGVLWAGTIYGGINLWGEVEDRFTHHRHDPSDPNSLSHRQVLSLFEDPTEGVVWIGTGGGGLNRFDQATQTFAHYVEEDGLPGDTVGCILADDAGFLWLGTVKGLSRFDPRTETFRNYDRQDGVGVLSAGLVAPGSCLQSQTGEMFFGGADGLYAFYPEKIRENLAMPPMAITALKIFNETVRRDLPPDEQIRLSHQENYISFEFAALDFVAPEKNQYAYMLEGLDRDWIYAGTRRHVDYPNLRPGDYVFRVKGSNNDGVWNEKGVAVRITVKPPFWQTWTFRGIVLVVLVMSVISGYRQRVRSIEAHSRRLEAQVKERTSQLEALYRADEELYRHLHLDQVLQALAVVAADLLRADKSAMMMWDESQARWVVRVGCGLSPEAMAQLSFAREAGSAGPVAAGGEPILVEDLAITLRQEEGEAEMLQALEAQGIRSFMLLPIQVHGEIFGLFNVGFAEPRAFTEDERRLFLALAQRASLAIENALVYEQAQELAAVEERQRLARDLHDAVSQTLFSASLISEALPDLWKTSPDEGAELLQKLRQLSRGALAEMRALLMELRPAALVEASLKDLLHQLAQAVTGRTGIPVTVAVEEPCELPTDVHVALYRIAQEALNNVVKHAQASQVEVSLRSIAPAGTMDSRQWTKDEVHRQVKGAQRVSVQLTIRDDGLGFDPRAVSQERLGLGIMYERAAAIGARLDIESEPRHGTRVSVMWTSDG